MRICGTLNCVLLCLPNLNLSVFRGRSMAFSASFSCIQIIVNALVFRAPIPGFHTHAVTFRYRMQFLNCIINIRVYSTVGIKCINQGLYSLFLEFYQEFFPCVIASYARDGNKAASADGLRRSRLPWHKPHREISFQAFPRKERLLPMYHHLRWKM